MKPYLWVLILFAVALATAPGVTRGDIPDDEDVLGDGEFEIPRAGSGAVGLANREGDFKRLMGELIPRVEELAREKAEAKREDLAARLAEEFGEEAAECLIRFRTPGVIPVLSHLLDHDDWAIRRLGIYGLQRNAAVSRLDDVLRGLEDENFLVRETAATTVAILHNVKFHPDLWPGSKAEHKAIQRIGKRRKADLAALKRAFKKERNPYTRSALEASMRALTKFKLLKICNEGIEEKDSDAPYVPRGGKGAGRGISRFSGPGKMTPSRGWCFPLAVYPKEPVGGVGSDPPLVPLRGKNNSLHFGHDCGWMMDGAGIYAIGDGRIRSVELAGDFGVLIVGEYRVDEEEFVTALNGHSSMWIFAPPGPVERRQLIGTIGLGFSAENGIAHAAHDHFGMFSGRYQRTKCFGRGGAGTPTEGWLIPADFLGPRVVGKELDPESY